MQGSRQSTGSQSSSTFADALANTHTLFTPKRVGFTLAGAFVLAGAAAFANTAGNQDVDTPSRSITVQSSASDTTQPESSSTDPETSASTDQSTAGAASSTSSTNVQVNVNGQSIAVPENGSVQKTVPTSDGTSQSSVSVNSSSNSSGTSLNLNVSSNSTSSDNSSGSFSSSSTVVTQNGGTTFISNN